MREELRSEKILCSPKKNIFGYVTNFKFRLSP